MKLTCTDRMPAYLTTVVMMGFMVRLSLPHSSTAARQTRKQIIQMGFQQNMEVLTFRGYVYSLNIKQKWKKLFHVLAQLKFSVFQCVRYFCLPKYKERSTDNVMSF